MQIHCHNCRNPLTVNPQGGQFQCPTCGAINAVGAPVQSGYAPQPQHQAPYAPPPPPPKKDNRKAGVLAAFMVLGAAALVLGWWGVLIGLPLLAWGIAGALGKVKSPGALVFPESAGKAGITALGIGLGAFVMTCGALGGASQGAAAERAEREAEEQAEREAAEKAAKEKEEAEKAAAKAAHAAELRANVSKAAADYKSGLDAVEALVNDGKMREAGEKMLAVAKGVEEYQELEPVPDEISALMPRHAELAPKIAEALTVINAADELEKNMARAEELTKGTKDGASWSEAKGLWEAAINNIETLESANENQRQHVPGGLPGKRKTIEKMLKKADGIVAQYEREVAARAAFQEACGPGGCIEVSARGLLKEYENNEPAAQAKYKGKRVAVTGVVESVALDLFDNPFVSISGGERWAFQTIHCQPANEKAANRLNKGQKILAIGTIGAEVIGSVVLEDCVF